MTDSGTKACFFQSCSRIIISVQRHHDSSGLPGGPQLSVTPPASPASLSRGCRGLSGGYSIQYSKIQCSTEQYSTVVHCTVSLRAFVVISLSAGQTNYKYFFIPVISALTVLQLVKVQVPHLTSIDHQ